MTDTNSKSFWPLFITLSLLMAATRSHHFASLTHLPDASLAVFFLAGFYLRPLWVFAAFLGLAGASDYIAISQFGVSDFCVSAAYVFLLPAYGALWFAGRRYAAHYRFQWGSLPWLLAFVLVGVTLNELLSSGGFYWFSGRFGDTSVSEFGVRFMQYFPQALEGLALYLGVAVVTHVVLTLSAGSTTRASSAH